MCNKHNKDIATNAFSICRKVAEDVYVYILNTENFPNNPNLPYTHLLQVVINKREKKKEGSSNSYLKHVTTYPKILFLKAKARKRQRNNRHILKSNIAYKFRSKSQLQNNAFFISYLRDKI